MCAILPCVCRYMCNTDVLVVIRSDVKNVSTQAGVSLLLALSYNVNCTRVLTPLHKWKVNKVSKLRRLFVSPLSGKGLQDVSLFCNVFACSMLLSGTARSYASTRPYVCISGSWLQCRWSFLHVSLPDVWQKATQRVLVATCDITNIRVLLCSSEQVKST